jgi:hypothetical protein
MAEGRESTIKRREVGQKRKGENSGVGFRVVGH